MRDTIYKILIILGIWALILSNIYIFNASDSYAKGLPSGNFKTNQYYNKPAELKKIRKQIFANLLSFPMTEEAAAGIMGNMACESGCDYTRTQGTVPWSGVVYGRTGLGLTQWTYYTRQDKLFETAKKLNVDWNTLECQLTMLKGELKGEDWDSFKKSKDIDACTMKFLNDYERAGVRVEKKRKSEARKIFKELTGTEPSASIGGDPSLGSDEKKSGNLSSSIVDEWDLVGMPAKSKLGASIAEIEEANAERLSIGENYSVKSIRNDLEVNKIQNIVDTARTCVVFIGLVLIFYSVMLLLAMLFDRVNTFLEISLVSILTLGHVRYSVEEETSGMIGYAGTAKMIRVQIIMLVLGLFLVSGGIFLYMSKFILWISDGGFL